MKGLIVLALAIALPAAAQDGLGAGKMAPAENMEQAVKKALKTASDGPYKEVTIYTPAGSFTGEVAQQTGSIVLLKVESGSTHINSGKKRIDYVYVSVEDVAGISFSGLQ